MTGIGNLTIDLIAQTASFNANITKAAGQLNSNAAKMNRSLQSINSGFDSVRRSAVGFAASFGVGAIAAGAKSILNFADDLGTAADQAGVSVERFQTLREGFRALEIDGEAFDTALKRLNATLGDMQSGVSNEATNALEEMGLKSRVLSGEIGTTDELLDAIAASAKKMGTDSQFAANMVDIFGRRVGVDLAAALRDGGDALRQQEKAFSDTGNVIKEDYIKQLAAANEQIDSFVSRSKNRLTIWAAETISYFEKVGAAAQHMGLQWEIGRLQSQADRNMILPETGRLATEQQRLALLERISELRGDQLQLVKQARPPSGADMFGVGPQLEMARKAFDRAANWTPIRHKSDTGTSDNAGQRAAEQAARLLEQFKLQGKELEGQLNVLQLRNAGFTDAANALEDQVALERELAQIREQYKGLDPDFVRGREEEVRRLITLQQETERFQDKLEQLDGLKIELDIDIAGDLARDTQRLIDQLPDLRSNMQRVWDELEEMGPRAFDTISHGIEDVLLGFSSMSDALRNISNELAHMAMQAFIFQPLKDALFGVANAAGGGGGGGGGFLQVISGVLGGHGGGGGIPGLPSADSLFSQMSVGGIGSGGSLPGFASGTDFAPGGLAWVGERGRELVNLPRGSQVLPSMRSEGLMRAIRSLEAGGGRQKGGGRGNVIFNVSTPDANSFRVSERQMARRARRTMLAGA